MIAEGKALAIQFRHARRAGLQAPRAQRVGQVEVQPAGIVGRNQRAAAVDVRALPVATAAHHRQLLASLAKNITLRQLEAVRRHIAV